MASDQSPRDEYLRYDDVTEDDEVTPSPLIQMVRSLDKHEYSYNPFRDCIAMERAATKNTPSRAHSSRDGTSASNMLPPPPVHRNRRRLHRATSAVSEASKPAAISGKRRSSPSPQRRQGKKQIKEEQKQQRDSVPQTSSGTSSAGTNVLSSNTTQRSRPMTTSSNGRSTSAVMYTQRQQPQEALGFDYADVPQSLNRQQQQQQTTWMTNNGIRPSVQSAFSCNAPSQAALYIQPRPPYPCYWAGCGQRFFTQIDHDTHQQTAHIQPLQRFSPGIMAPIPRSANFPNFRNYPHAYGQLGRAQHANLLSNQAATNLLHMHHRALLAASKAMANMFGIGHQQPSAHSLRPPVDIPPLLTATNLPFFQQNQLRLVQGLGLGTGQSLHQSSANPPSSSTQYPSQLHTTP